MLWVLKHSTFIDKRENLAILKQWKILSNNLQEICTHCTDQNEWWQRISSTWTWLASKGQRKLCSLKKTLKTIRMSRLTFPVNSSHSIFKLLFMRVRVNSFLVLNSLSLSFSVLHSCRVKSHDRIQCMQKKCHKSLQIHPQRKLICKILWLDFRFLPTRTAWVDSNLRISESSNPRCFVCENCPSYNMLHTHAWILRFAAF